MKNSILVAEGMIPPSQSPSGLGHPLLDGFNTKLKHGYSQKKA